MFARNSLVALALTCSLLAACGGSSQSAIPVGEQTLRNVVLRPLPINIARRGTHEVLVSGQPLYFADSSTIDLFRHANHPIDITGTFSANTDTKLAPVINVTAIKDDQADLREWTVPAFSMSLSVPASWKADIKKSIATFSASGSTIPPLTILREKMTDLPYDWAAATDGTGAVAVLPSPVSLHRAVMHRTPDSLNVSIEDQATTAKDATVITFIFAPGDVLQPLVSSDLVERILQSVRISGTLAASGSTTKAKLPPTGTTTATGSRVAKPGGPCGGVAGILCPAGQYCIVEDQASNTGHCTAY